MSKAEDYVCTLDKPSIKKAKDELNENPEDRLAAVQAFRDWIKEQPHIRCPQTDTQFLLRFLRWAKFSQIRAREKFENYINLRYTIPGIYLKMDTAETGIQEVIDVGYVVFLPNRLPNGCRLLVIKVDALTKSKHKYMIYFRAVTCIFEYLSREDMTQVNGYNLFIDFTGSTQADITKFISKENSNTGKEWMKATPGRFKNVYYYNAGIFVEMCITFLRLFMPKKLIDRISVHDTMEEVYTYIPKHCLPVEYLPDDYNGPNVGTMQSCREKTKAALLEKEFRDSLLFKSGDAFGIDESKKPKETVTDHFRKLNVD